MKNFLLIAFLFLVTTVFAQKDPNVYDFFGGKRFGNEIVFYRLLFQIENGKVSGYAFTDEQGSKETKSVINGTFNAKNKTILFSETKKLVTKSRQAFNEFCYLSGIVSFDLNPRISKIKGSFVEKTINGETCNQGTIEIISIDSYKRLKNTIAQEEALLATTEAVVKDKPSTKKEIKTSVIPTFASDEKIIIKDDEEVTIFWNSDKFILDIWDDAKEDDDQVTVSFNDEVILDKHTLMNKKETLEFDLIDGENKIVFTADNTGFIANNTARVDLFDDNIKHQIITKLKLNKSVTVYLVRK